MVPAAEPTAAAGRSVRVLHVQKVAGIGGSERHLLALLPSLAEVGVETRMCVLATRHAAVFVDAAERGDVDVVVMPAGPDINPVLVPKLVAEIRRFRPDVVHTHLVHADLHGQVAARVSRVPGVSSIHGAPAFYRRQPYRSVGRLAGRLARRRIAISEYLAGYVAELGLAPPDRIRVVPYGIDAGAWAPQEGEREQARRAMGIDEDVVTVGIASRLIEGKGLDLFVQAMAGAMSRAPDMRLLVAGDGPLRARLTELARSTCPPGRARFLGFVADVRSFMHACDVVAFSSSPALGEGFGLAALEAMAAGRPVIATDVGPLAEVVAHDVTGIVVPAGSAPRLCDAILSLAQDAGLRRRMGAEGAKRAVEVFGLDAMVRRTRAVYDEVTQDG